MSAIRPLPWQQQAWTQLDRARRHKQLAHAWLVSGPRGVGKRPLIGAVVAMLLCEQLSADGTACGDCNACKMLLSGGHPDAHLLCLDGHLGLSANNELQRGDGITHWQPDSKSKRTKIAIEGVRSLIEKLGIASHRQGNKIAVISPAEDLNRSSANALLKTIEEPTPNTYVFLIADQALNLSATLRSRCQQLRLGIPARSASLNWLQAQEHKADAAASVAALDLARGAPLLALSHLQSKTPSEVPGWYAALDELAQGRGDPMVLAAAIDKDTVIPFLHACQGWLVQRLRDRIGDPDTLSGRRVNALAEELADAHRRLESNAPAQLVVDAMLIGWIRLLAPQPVGSPQSRIMQAGARP